MSNLRTSESTRSTAEMQIGSLSSEDQRRIISLAIKAAGIWDREAFTSDRDRVASHIYPYLWRINQILFNCSLNDSDEEV